MSKRKANAFSQPIDFILCEDLILIIVNFLLSKPKIEYVRGKQIENDMIALETYFALPLVNKAFGHAILKNTVDWKSMLEKKYSENKTITQEAAKVFVYHSAEQRKLWNLIDAIVLKEKITYRSPVKKQLSEGRLSHKKLRHAKYPNADTKNKVLDALRKYERLRRDDCAMRKKYRCYYY